MKVALFAPCYVDQLYPDVGMAAVRVLERLGVSIVVPDGAACCGQPMANAGFARGADGVLETFVDTFVAYEKIVVISGSCAAHVRHHATAFGERGRHVAERTVEFCAFLHDDIGVSRVAGLNVSLARRVAVHIGCHGLRGLGLAKPTELNIPPFDKVRALLETVHGLTFAKASRPDECCGFGGSFAVGEPAISTRMGLDRLDEYASAQADTIVSTDVSCLMHLSGLARAGGAQTPMLHVAQVLAGVPA